MKKWMPIFTLLSAPLMALPLGNPAAASLLTQGVFWEGCEDGCLDWSNFGLEMGYCGFFVRDHHLRFTGGGDHATIPQTDEKMNAGYLGLSYCDRILFFSRLGNTNFVVDFDSNPIETQAVGQGALTFRTNTDFSYGVGGNVVLWQCGGWTIGFEGEYFHTSPEIKAIDGTYLNGPTFDYSEWQVGAGISYAINIASCTTDLVPYIGFKYGDTRVDMDGLTVTSLSVSFPDFEADRQWGYAVGVSLVGCEKVSLTAEGRFMDETGFYFSGVMRF